MGSKGKLSLPLPDNTVITRADLTSCPVYPFKRDETENASE